MSRKFHFGEECLAALRALGIEPGKRRRKGTITIPAPVLRKPEPVPEKPEDSEPEETGKDGPVRTQVVTRTDVGLLRSNNQDSVIEAWPLLGVADGMGGHRGGEVASGETRDHLTELLKDKEPDPDVLRASVVSVNSKVYIHQPEDKDLAGMGTTLTALWVAEKQIHIAQVGDSRAYRLRDKKLEQMTRDHSVVAEMVREGIITKEQAAIHPMRNIITRAVGSEEDIEVDVTTEERRTGDIWLVCSDGLYGMVSDRRMGEILSTREPDKAADDLLKEALDAGGRDNVSFVIFVDGEGQP